LDIVLVNAAVFGLPTSRRAGAIVYDGPLDLDLWRPPGPDRDLLHVYGETLPSVLDRERKDLTGRKLALGQALRVHAGKLHCDYLVWVASRPPHGDDEQAPAPDVAMLEKVAQSALELCNKHHTTRVAFGVLGAGPGAGDGADRLAALVRGAHAFRATHSSSGRATSIEEVLVCSASAAEIAKARRLTERLARPDAPVVVKAPAAVRVPSRASAGGSSSARTPRAAGTGRGRKKLLDPQRIEYGRASASPYDRSREYIEGELLVHPKFGVGEVQTVQRGESMVMVLFEDGEERRLLHGR
jgi:hypothetical protein